MIACTGLDYLKLSKLVEGKVPKISARTPVARCHGDELLAQLPLLLFDSNKGVTRHPKALCSLRISDSVPLSRGTCLSGVPRHQRSLSRK